MYCMWATFATWTPRSQGIHANHWLVRNEATFLILRVSSLRPFPLVIDVGKKTLQLLGIKVMHVGEKLECCWCCEATVHTSRLTANLGHSLACVFQPRCDSVCIGA